MFYVQYLLAEVRRRRGRTALTALGLAVGVGLVVIVGALSKGLDDAQEQVLEPLTGVGTDLAVSRPLLVSGDDPAGRGTGDPFSQLSDEEQRLLEQENENHDAAFNYSDLGEPGERFSEVSLLSSQLSFPSSEVARIRGLDGAEDAAAGLSLRALRVEGVVPESGEVANPHGPGGGFEFSDLTVSGVDVRKPELAAVTPDQIVEGRYFSEIPELARGEAVIDLAYARQNGIAVGQTTEPAGEGEEFEVVGLASAPLGGQASQAYVELRRLQEPSDRNGRGNGIRGRADSVDAVAEVVTAADLADRVGGSLADAENLSSKLGTALAMVALVAAFLIASLLTLSSVQKRTRELGTLKALGWRRRRDHRRDRADAPSLRRARIQSRLRHLRPRNHQRRQHRRRPRCPRGPWTAPPRDRPGAHRRLARRCRRRVARRPAPPSRGASERGVTHHPTRRTKQMSTVSDTTPTYELEGATRSFGEGSTRVLALDALSLTIGRGEFVAVFGPSGSGKTTLLQLLGALDRPSSGSVRFEGQPLEQLGDSALADLRLRAMGFVFQQFNLIPTLSAAENVEAALAPLAMPRHERREAAEEHLEAVGLAPRARHLPAQLSGGEQQRVAIARALAGEHRVVLADEPTGNLDNRSGEMVMELLARLHRELQLTLVLVTHDEWIAERADRVLRVADGRLVKDSAGPGDGGG